MDYRRKSNRLLPALALGYLLTVIGTAQAIPTMLPPELSENGYLKVGEQAVRIPVANPDDHFWVGERVPLIQKNLQYYVGLIESEYTQTRVFTVPRTTYDQQGIAWITEQNEIVFGVPTYTVRGSFYLQPGEWLTVLDEDERAYRALCSRYGKTFPIEVTKKTEGVAFQAELPEGMEQRVMVQHGRSKLMNQARRVITDDYLREVSAATGIAASRPRPVRERRPSNPIPTAVAPAPVTEPKPSQPVHIPDPVVTTQPDPRPVQPAVAAVPEPEPPPAAPAQTTPEVTPPPVHETAAAQPAPPTSNPEEKPRWLISNTEWSQTTQDVKQGRTRVITPDTVHTALALGDELEEPEAEPTPEPAAVPTPTVDVAMAEPAEASPAATEESDPGAMATAPAANDVALAPVAGEDPGATGQPDESSVQMAQAEAGPDTHEVSDPGAEPETDEQAEAAAAAIDVLFEDGQDLLAGAQESMVTMVAKIVLFLVIVLAGAVALIMGIAWALNRSKGGKKNKAAKAEQEAQGEETAQAAPLPVSTPPPIPEEIVETPDGLKDEFSKKISFNGGVFTGSLDGLTVSQLIQFLHSVEETGALSVTHGSGQKAGKIIFNRGEIIDVRCEGDRGEEALREVVPFQDGIFAFSRQPVNKADTTVKVGTMALLMNVLKDMDEAGEHVEEEAETTAGAL